MYNGSWSMVIGLCSVRRAQGKIGVIGKVSWSIEHGAWSMEKAQGAERRAQGKKGVIGKLAWSMELGAWKRLRAPAFAKAMADKAGPRAQRKKVTGCGVAG
jgi:hypothetical protein